MQVLTEQEKSDGAHKWAATNQTQGEVVFTNDEIRDKWYELAPLSAKDRILVAPPTPPQQEQGGPPFGRSAQEEDELFAVLRSAIEANNIDVIDAILGVKR
jgi:hypothetical protein